MTFLQIRKRIAEELGMDYSDTSTDNNDDFSTKLKAWVNARYKVIAGKRSWNWLITDTIIQVVPQITTGTVEWTNASTTITFSSAPTVSVAGYWIQGSESKDWYIINAHTANVTTATLTKAFIGTTAATDTYTLRKVYYALPSDCQKILNVRQTRENVPLQYIPIRHFDKYAANRTRVADPLFYTVIGLDSSRLHRMEFYPVPTVAMNVAMRYYAIPADMTADGDIPQMPEQFHDVLVWDVLGTYGYMFLDDTRVDRAKLIARDLYNDMVKNEVSGENIPVRQAFDVDLSRLSGSALSSLRLPIQ
jgi:hypothetical protein